MYLYEQAQDLFALYYKNMKSEILDGGHLGMAEYMVMLENMDEENM